MMTLTQIMITPTEEQQNILSAGGRVVKINARAGTGKTATLLMIAEQNLDKKILYLVFNSRNRQEAKSKFPTNVKVHTIHSFVHPKSGSNFRERKKIHPSQYFNHFSANKEILATLTSNFIVFFLNSIYKKPADAIEPFTKKISDELRGIFTQSQSDILEISRSTLNSWYNFKDCPHDFYLKMSHLENKFQSQLSMYDLVLIDEAQDLSPIMIDALATYKGRIIIVGDSHQQIYSFRYAVDAMQTFIHDELHELTKSFRFGEKIASLTSKFIESGKEDEDFKISGTPGIKSEVYFYDGFNFIENRPKTAVLSRTNFSLFQTAMTLKSKKQHFCFGRDISKELKKTLDVYWLSIDERTKIKDDLIKSFGSIKEIEKYATIINDYQLLKTIELVNTYKKEFPGIISEFLGCCKKQVPGQDQTAITLSTIHTAKGQDYDHVIIHDDVIARLDRSCGKAAYNYLEEINIVYVGITRAIKNLYLPIGMKQLFDEEWQKYTSEIPVVSTRHVHKTQIPNVKQTIFHRKKEYAPFVKDLHKKEKIESIPVTPEFHVGDTVRTLSGCGQIVKIDGDQCLIVMENKIAKVWERRSTLVKL